MQPQDTAAADRDRCTLEYLKKNVDPMRTLKRDEERVLFLAVKTGDMEARNVIVQHNLRLVSYVAKRYQASQYVFDRLCSEGSHVLFHAIDLFKVEMGNKFSTYATWWLRQSMSKFLSIKDGNGLASIIDVEAKSEPDHLHKSEVSEVISNSLELLTDREQDIIRRRFGLNGDMQTLDVIGRDYSLSKERIRQIESKALRKLGPLLSELM